MLDHRLRPTGPALALLPVLLVLQLLQGLAAPTPARAATRPGSLPPSAVGSHLPPRPFLDRTSVLLLTTLGAAAVAGKLTENDAFMTRSLDNRHLEGLYGAGNRYGAGVWLSLASLGSLGAGLAFHDPRLTNLGRDLGTSLVATWTVVWGLKLTVPSRRPNGGPYSFPSGHTATAFAAAPVLSAYLGRGAGYLAYGLAGVTGLARMEDGKHHLADVLAGAAIGTVIGHEVSRRGRLRWTLAPSGIAVSARF